MAPTATMISTSNADNDRNEHDSESNIEDASSCASDSLMGKENDDKQHYYIIYKITNIQLILASR